MLINFKFSNYKSFKDEAEFSMEPLTNNGSISNAVETGYKKAPYVYRTSAIFGANASGKSNFIEAMNYFQHLIESSYLKRLNEAMELPSYKLYDKQENSRFECEFIKNGIAYRYLIELNDTEIVKEEAFYTELSEDKREKCLFKRTSEDFVSPYGLDKEFAKQTLKNRLLISEFVNNRNIQDPHILNIYNWIVMDIAILSTPYELNLRSDIARRDLDLEEKTKFLNKADIHIDRLVSNRDGLFSIHKNENGKEVAFNFEEEESEGTIILLALCGNFVRGSKT